MPTAMEIDSTDNNSSAVKAFAAITSHLSQWADDEDDGYNDFGYQEDAFMPSREDAGENTSRRLSGAFTAAVLTPRGQSTHVGSSDKDDRSKSTSFSFQSQTPSQLSSAEPAASKPASRSPAGYQASLPVATPAQTSYISNESETHNMDVSPDQEVNRGDNMSHMSSGRNRLNIDGDYRPYHDAVVALLRSIHYGRNNTTFLDSHLQYIRQIMTSVYARSTQLQQYDDSMAHLKNTRLLENEGNLWSLIYRLLAHESDSPRARDDKPASHLLLWTDGSESNFYAKERGRIQDWIQIIVEQNAQLDPAGMTKVIATYLNNDNDSSESHPIPDSITRRSIVLEWVESCHQRSIPTNLGIGGDEKSSVMWKDSVEYLTRASKNGLHQDGKITAIHPDAPFLVRNSQQQKSSFGSPTTSTISPLHGKDEAQETYLLSTCLSLIKAGRFSDALDLCRSAGQPWRAASWDGNAAHGIEEVIVEDGVNETMKKTVKVGNPTRPLWKRNMWNIGRSLHALLAAKDDEDRSKAVVTGNSLAYEAAISSILADDVMTASSNPVLSNNYMDIVWLQYRGIQAHFFEQVYCAHNNARRNLSTEYFPLDGTDYKQEEEEQLAATDVLGRFEERTFFASLDQRMKRNMMGEDEDELWREGMNAFILGLNDVEAFLCRATEKILNTIESQEDGGTDINLMGDEDASLLRFTIHILLFLDSLCRDDPLLITFRETTVIPHKTELLRLYVEHLAEEKALWHLTTLYASLLPMENTIEVCTNFWARHIHDESDRRMVVNTAREYFSKNLDLVILRRVVRQCISDIDSENNTIDVGFQMNSINWLCAFPEHYGDALTLSNVLLRKYLLQIESDSIDDDWTSSPKLQNCKTFVAHYLPPDIAMMAVDSLDDDAEEDDTYLGKAYVEDNAAEFDALTTFLSAHTEYMKWKRTITSLSPVVEYSGVEEESEMTLETEIKNKMAIKSFVDRKKEVASNLIEASNSALDHLMSVLTYEDGWLESMGTIQSNVIGEEEHLMRLDQLKSLQSKCVPKATILAFRIMDETAKWMTVFCHDILDHFHQEQIADIRRRIESKFALDESKMSPFQPTTWYYMARLLSKTVVSTKHCFDQESMKYIMKCMAESEVKLLCQKERSL